MAVAISATTTIAKRSWADIVRGDVTTAPDSVEDVALEEVSKSSLQPAARGTYLCRCWGEVLVMFGYYGWIKPLEEIDHSDAAKTAGRIYVHKRDIKSDVKLAQGDIVSFYFYSDDQGFGAECCTLEQRAPKELRVDAEEFVPTGGSTPGWNPFATEFVPNSSVIATRFNLDALEFEPPAFGNKNDLDLGFIPLTTQAVIHSTPNVMAINPAFLSDDESEDGSSFNDADISSNGDTESLSDETDLSSEHGVECDDDIAVVRVPFVAKGSASDDSTSAGASSDSDLESVAFVRPPPGLELLAGFRPPPGLAL